MTLYRYNNAIQNCMFLKSSHHHLAQLVQREFLNAESKLAGKCRTKHIFRILPIALAHEDSTATPSYPQLVEQLEIEHADNRELREKIEMLEARVQQLERTTPQSHAEQADVLVQHNSLVACGPDTYTNFLNFSIDGVIQELREQVPDIYELFMQLYR